MLEDVQAYSVLHHTSGDARPWELPEGHSLPDVCTNVPVPKPLGDLAKEVKQMVCLTDLRRHMTYV